MIVTVSIYCTLPHKIDKIQLKKCGTRYEKRKKGFCGQHWTFMFLRPDEIKEASLDDRELLLDFETAALASCPRTTLVITNTSAIKARFSLEMDHFKAAKPPTPPDGE